METIKPMKMVKLFVLGRPGTGKSTAGRLMAQTAREHGWRAEHIDDYSILYWMYLNDHADRFHPASAKLDGFEVVDASVLDEALTILHYRVDFALTRVLDRTKLVIIEFARSNYQAALERFGEDFLKESYFLFLSSALEECMKRIEQRARHPVYEGDRYISRRTMEAFYFSDDILATRRMLETTYELDRQRVRIMRNSSTEELFLARVRQFVRSVIHEESGS